MADKIENNWTETSMLWDEWNKIGIELEKVWIHKEM